MTEDTTLPDRQQRLEPGTLWQRIVTQTEYALQQGALLSIPTHYEYVEQQGVRFLVRILANLVRKEVAKQQQDQISTASGKPFDPFLPYEEDLFVAHLSPTHVCLLNKFNVVEHHSLIITKAFEDQEQLLTLADLEAMWMGLAEVDGLAFYNGGKLAGASQQHKHLQLIPFPMTPEGVSVPIATLLPPDTPPETIVSLAGLPFVHAYTRLPQNLSNTPAQAAATTLELYYAMLRSVGLEDGHEAVDNRQSGAYNLLATRDWMLLVPRSQESFEEIPVNSLGFAGTLLVRNPAQLEFLKQLSPMQLLCQVGLPQS